MVEVKSEGLNLILLEFYYIKYWFKQVGRWDEHVCTDCSWPASIGGMGLDLLLSGFKTSRIFYTHYDLVIKQHISSHTLKKVY